MYVRETCLCVYVHLSAFLLHMSVCLCVRISVCFFIVYLSVCLQCVCLSACLFIYIIIMSVCLSVCLCLCRSIIYPFVYLFFFFFPVLKKQLHVHVSNHFSARYHKVLPSSIEVAGEDIFLCSWAESNKIVAVVFTLAFCKSAIYISIVPLFVFNRCVCRL